MVVVKGQDVFVCTRCLANALPARSLPHISLAHRPNHDTHCKLTGDKKNLQATRNLRAILETRTARKLTGSGATYR